MRTVKDIENEIASFQIKINLLQKELEKLKGSEYQSKTAQMLKLLVDQNNNKGEKKR